MVCMKVLIATVGTRGDVQPYLSLAIGLKAAGHEVTMCTCPRFSSFIDEQGIAYSHLDDGLLQLLESEAGRSMFQNLSGVLGVLRTIPKVLKQVGPVHRKMVADAWTAVESVDPDVIVYHPKMFCVPAFAALRNIPAVSALLYPMQVPTGETPFFGMPRLPLGRNYNRSTYHLVNSLTRFGTRAYLREWRAKYDKTGRTKSSGPIQTSTGDPIPVIHGYSASVCPKPCDWPDFASVTGYWFMPDYPGWSPSPELSEFLDRTGPPIVYVGFGSMAGTTPRNTTSTIMSAIEKADVRAVVATGWGGLALTDLPPTVHMLESVPHDWLFPKMAAVVHHGGAGTTAAGLRAGCPTVICPFGLDQPFWGRRVAELGVGAAPISQRRLTANLLSAAIVRATQDESIHEAAKRIGAAIRQEDGISRAVNIIERVVVQTATR